MHEELIDVPGLTRVLEALRSRCGDSVLESAYEKRELSVRIPREDLLTVLNILRHELGFDALNDMIGLDHFGRTPPFPKRFSVLYQLYNFRERLRLRVAIDVAEDETVDSITGL